MALSHKVVPPIRSGRIASQPIRKHCSPLSNETGKNPFQILLASSKNENGTIDYNKFDSLVNYQSSPARAATAEDHAPRMSQPKGSFFKFPPDFESKLS